jgi:hypothetical protein
MERHSHRLSSKVLKANEILQTHYKQNYLKKKFPLLHNELNKIDFIILAFTIGVSYHARMSYTGITMSLGNLIVYLVYKYRSDLLAKANLQMIDNDCANSDKINEGGSRQSHKQMSYDKFRASLNMSSSDIIKLGDYFLELLTIYPINIFEREVNPASYYNQETSKLTISKDCIDELKQNIMIHPSSLPMICKPNK